MCACPPRAQVANAKEERIRDQAAFNMITKATPGLQPYRTPDGKDVPRVFLACRGSGGGAPRAGSVGAGRAAAPWWAWLMLPYEPVYAAPR